MQDTSHESEPFPEDWLLLLVKDHSGKTLCRKAFHSSYQQFRVDAIDLDGDGDCELLFTTGEGRGTSVRKEVLTIERLQDGSFHSILSLPISGYYSGGKKWWSSVAFRDTDNNGTEDIELQLNADDLAGLQAAPVEQTRVIKWNSSENTFKASKPHLNIQQLQKQKHEKSPIIDNS